MPKEEHNPVNMIDAIGCADQDPSGTVELSVNMRRRLEKLKRWRIDPALLEFSADAPKFEGGLAVVSKAFFNSSTDDARDQAVSGGNLKSNDCIAKLEDEEGRQEAGESDEKTKDKGETGAEEGEEKSDVEESRRPKAVAVKKMKMGMKTGSELVRVLSLTLREAEFLVGLSHENVTKLEGFVEDLPNRMIWLVFNWEDNGTLKDFVAAHEWEIPERISLISDVTKGVEYLHSREPPIVHGDLKSINVLVNSKCRAAISDFGSAHHPVAKSANEETVKELVIEQPHESSPSLEAMHCPSTNTITLTYNMYTLRWAAPEVLGEGDVNVASDIWALGCVAYEVMTDLIPFQDVRDDVTVIVRVVRGDLPSISSDARMLLIQALCSLPMIIPNPRRTADTADVADRWAKLLIELGEMHRNQRDYSNASKYYTQALGIYDDIGDIKGKANALFQHGVMHTLEGQYDRAATCLSNVLKVYNDMGDRQGTALTLLALGGVHLGRSEYSQAVTFYSECLQIFTDIGDRKGRADALWGRASIHHVQSEYVQAAELYSESLQMYTDIGDSNGRAKNLWGLASLHRLQSDYSEATTLYSECLQIRTDMGDREGRAAALWNLAELHRIQKQPTQAAARYCESQEVYTDIGDREGIANALFGRANLCHLQGDYSQAVALYFKSLQIRKDIGDRRGIADAIWGLANAHHFQSEYSHAVTFYSQCLEIRTEIGDGPMRADVLSNLADVHLAQMEYNQAFKCYSECLQIRTDFGDIGGRAGALSGLAEVHQLRKEYIQAVELFSEALAIYTEIGDRTRKPFVILGLAKTYYDQGHYGDAIHYYEQAAETLQQIGCTDLALSASKQVSNLLHLL